MARRTFFSFHYQRDIWRVNQIRNLISQEGDPFQDASLWEEAQRKGDAAIKQMINEALRQTTVTCFLVGYQTAGRKYVQYELERSMEIGNGLLAITIHNLKTQQGVTDYPGPSLFPFFSSYPTYNWINDRGNENIGDWIEAAYQASPKAERDRKIKNRTSTRW